MFTADNSEIYSEDANIHVHLERPITWEETDKHTSTEIFIVLSNKYICFEVINKN